MQEVISVLIVVLLLGGLIIAGIYFFGAFFDAVTAFLSEIIQINRKKREPKVEDPIKILKIRYAKGEIKKEEYEEMKKTLESKFVP